MKPFFVTSSGTEIGKTLVTTILVRQLREAGRSVRALKPVISDYTLETARGSDTALLLDAMGVPPTEAEIAGISPWRFAAPLSPDMAARREGRELALREIVGFCRTAMAGLEEVLLIEGVGGVMVPLNDSATVRDWVVALDIPAILVVGSYLGTISHTLTALEVLAVSGVSVAGVVVSETQASGVPLSETVDSIGQFANGVPVCALPRLSRTDDAPDLLRILRMEE